MFFIVFLITFAFDLTSSNSQSDYNSRLLPYVKRKFDRIENSRGIESRLFEGVNRVCVLEVLELNDDDEDYLNVTEIHLNLRDEAINRAFEICTEDLKLVMSEDQLRRNLKNHENSNYSQQIDCFKLEFQKLNNQDSILLKNSNLSFDESICGEILEDFEVKLMKGFKDFKEKTLRKFNLQICKLENLMRIGRQIALRYVLMANGDFAYNDILSLKNSFVDDARRILRDLISCFVEEMKAGNYGVEENGEEN